MSTQTQYWLLKSEPSTFSIEDLVSQKRSFWDGVRNYQARNFLKQMKKGDLGLFYHSSCDEVGVAGTMKIVSAVGPDPTQFDKKSKYYDPKATTETPRWFSVWVSPLKTFSRIVTLPEIKKLPTMREHPLVQRGNRLSVLPLSEVQFASIVKVAYN